MTACAAARLVEILSMKVSANPISKVRTASRYTVACKLRSPEHIVLGTICLLTFLLLPGIGITQNQTGYFEFSHPGGFGSLATVYVVHYEMPGVFRTNVTERIRVWMNVTQFSQTTSKVEARSLKLSLSVNGKTFPRSIDASQWLELGRTWGPFSFDFLITGQQIGLGPSETVDVALTITIDVVEYWQPPIGNAIAYPITFSNQQPIAAKMTNPEAKPQPPSLTELVQSLVRQLLTASAIKLILFALGGGALFSLSVRFFMPRHFLPLLLAGGILLLLVGILLYVSELFDLSIFCMAFGVVLVVAALILFVFMHRREIMF
jgi:hypothetical protein